MDPQGHVEDQLLSVLLPEIKNKTSHSKHMWPLPTYSHIVTMIMFDCIYYYHSLEPLLEGWIYALNVLFNPLIHSTVFNLFKVGFLRFDLCSECTL